MTDLSKAFCTQRKIVKLKVLIPSTIILSVSMLGAQTNAPKHKLPATFRFIAPSDVNPAQLLPPPPKDGSPEQQREMAEVRRLIQTRSKERYAQAAWDASHEDPTPFAAAIGPGFDLTKLPATAKLLADVLNDQTVATSAAKEFFKRKFPVAAEMPG